MKWVLVDGGNVVKNIIVYHEESDYTPPEGQRLKQVDDSVAIGDTVAD